MSKDKIILFDDKKNCCACGACMNVCPKDAIRMEEDEYGFLYPQIDETKCVQCGACKKVCAYQNEQVKNAPIKCYAAVNKNKSELMKSASGGIFAAMATSVLKEGGVVFGAALDFEDGHAHPHHVAVRELSQLYRLQGSKYVQSAIENTYMEAKKELESGKKVLFSGTPCQIAGLYGYLRKEYENLCTVDVICHGVPSARMFDDFLQNETKKRNAKSVKNYIFRDKKKGWGMNGRIQFEMKNGTEKIVYIPARLASYNTFFLDGFNYRENCYSCKYACSKRSGDVTLGDYWGIERENPELLKNKEFDVENGISCIIANSKKGMDKIQDIFDMSMYKTQFEKIANKNGQLKHPSKRPEKRENLMKLYSQKGYSSIDEYFHKKYRKQIIVHTIFNAFPIGVRLKIKKVLHK